MATVGVKRLTYEYDEMTTMQTSTTNFATEQTLECFLCSNIFIAAPCSIYEVKCEQSFTERSHTLMTITLSNYVTAG